LSQRLSFSSWLWPCEWCLIVWKLGEFLYISLDKFELIVKSYWSSRNFWSPSPTYSHILHFKVARYCLCFSLYIYLRRPRTSMVLLCYSKLFSVRLSRYFFRFSRSLRILLSILNTSGSWASPFLNFLTNFFIWRIILPLDLMYYLFFFFIYSSVFSSSVDCKNFVGNLK